MTSNSTNGSDIKTLFVCDGRVVFTPDRSWREWNWLAVAILNTSLSPISLVLNVAVLYIAYRVKALQVFPNMVLMEMTIKDTFMAVVTLPAFATVHFLLYKGQANCGLIAAVAIINSYFLLVSFLVLSLISLDRYVAIFYPFFYKKSFQNAKVLLEITIAIWLLPASVIALGSTFDKGHVLVTVYLFIEVIFTYIWNVFVHVQIYRLVSKVKRSVRSEVRPRLPSEFSRMESKSKGTRLATMMVASIFVCYTPFLALLVWSYYEGPDGAFPGHGWLDTLAMANSCINPILYHYQLHGVQHHMRFIQVTSK